MRSTFYRRHGKRAFDLVIAMVGIVVLSPVIAATAIAVRVALGHPCLFRQTRAGRQGKPFELIKFRTMSNVYGTDGELRPDHERLHPLGRVLRSLSLDELPELVNVVTGDMSLVGPRPFLYEYIPFYSERQHRRHDVRPGMTGLAQVRGRNELSWNERFELDLEYIERMSFAEDLRLMLLTVIAALRRRGINESNNTTSRRFDQGETPSENIGT